MAGTFGSWIQKLRKEAGVDLRTIAQASKIHFTTIGRIEKGQNDPTLDSAIKIANALNGNPAELYQVITERAPLLPIPTIEKHHTIPTLADVMLFENLMQEKPKTAGEYYAHLLNKVIEVFFADVNKTGEISSFSYSSDEQKWLYESFQQPVFTALDVHKFLLYPPPQITMLFFTPKYNYPAAFTSTMILETFKNCGVMLADDVALYVADAFENIKVDADTNDVKIVQKYVKIEQIKSKLEPQNQISGIKLNDILLLDQELSEQGEIFMMAWNATNEEVRVKSQLNRSGAGRLLISMGRFLAANHNPEPDWLLQLHSLD